MEYLRNLPLRQASELAHMVEIQPGRVISMALSKSDHCQITLLAFADGESVSEEQYFGDTLYYVLEGEMPLVMDGETRILKRGECLAVAAQKLHTVGGTEPFKLLQITVQ